MDSAHVDVCTLASQNSKLFHERAAKILLTVKIWKMASSPTKTSTLKKEKKEESFLEKVTTLGRRKKIKDLKEVNDLNSDGRNALEAPASPVELTPDNFILENGEERSMIEPDSREDPKLKELIQVLMDWINEEMKEQRVIVRDLEEDLYDGQILGNLLEKLAGIKLEVREVMQSEVFQKQKLQVVLDTVNKLMSLPRWNQQKWSVDSIHSKNLIAILHLLVALAFHFKAPIRIPEYVSAKVVVVQKKDNLLVTNRVTEEITTTNEAIGGRFERDAFDTLFDHAPDKLNVVKKSLISFANKHLNKLNLEVTDLDNQFHDGVYFILLMGLLEGYYVPLYHYHVTPMLFEEKVHNVSFALDLMDDAGLPKAKARPEDVVNLDLKSTMRVLYNIFTKYKHLT
ncbi:beta-parvin-like isoform X2 [Acanthaster planci]|uniref:Beta-parvin-like isoform X2 n=1 Tax=Acanthaster planci TaxID=133434 RepID=A0A8B7ZAF9_ACAPL|nr:beta-parvin-like isoform X2 [Acanthaster planci]